MSEYKAPLEDIRYIMNDVFDIPGLWQSMPRLADVIDPETADAILEESAKISEGLIAPLNRTGDEEGVTFNDGQVKTPAGYKEAFQTVAEGGWIGLSGDPEFGGMGMPKTLNALYEEMMCGADVSFSLYSGLTSGACLAINNHATDALKQKFLPQLYQGTWTGTMCLTEPHCGTDLGIIRSKAIPTEQDSYLISGTKIFITAGEHDLSENIIHLVLAKLPDAPAGPKGISLFLVPKYKVNVDNSLGELNGVSCGSTEHKMGIHASATCVMNFDEAEGFLVGEVNKGLAAMFTMMNYERLSVGIQGLGCSQLSYQRAVAYAKDRLQSRAATGVVNKDKDADPIIVHPDVRRMLMNMRALTEAGRAFSTYTAAQLDIVKYSDDAAEKSKAEDLVALLTPVAKAFMTDMGLDICVQGQQVFGGHGYVREWGQEQLVRDVRIAQIYEGTNGIQAMDLIGRKVLSNQGAYLKLFAQEIESFIKSNQTDNMAEFNLPLAKGLKSLVDVTYNIADKAKSNPNAVGSAAMEYLHLFGYVAYGYMWAKMAVASLDKDNAFHQAKVTTARYYFNRVFPRINGLIETIQAPVESLMDLPESSF
jgi:alkylation response protein AidB-like acyl-CoA dehydrogenase